MVPPLSESSKASLSNTILPLPMLGPRWPPGPAAGRGASSGMLRSLDSSFRISAAAASSAARPTTAGAAWPDRPLGCQAAGPSSSDDDTGRASRSNCGRAPAPDCQGGAAPAACPAWPSFAAAACRAAAAGSGAPVEPLPPPLPSAKGAASASESDTGSASCSKVDSVFGGGTGFRRGRFGACRGLLAACCRCCLACVLPAAAAVITPGASAPRSRSRFCAAMSGPPCCWLRR